MSSSDKTRPRPVTSIDVAERAGVSQLCLTSRIAVMLLHLLLLLRLGGLGRGDPAAQGLDVIDHVLHLLLGRHGGLVLLGSDSLLLIRP